MLTKFVDRIAGNPQKSSTGPAVRWSLAALAACAGPSAAKDPPPSPPDAAVVRAEADPARAAIPFLSWDTEGGDRARTNLLRDRAGVALRVFDGGRWRAGADFPTVVETASGATRYRLTLAPGAALEWRVQPRPDGLALTLHWACPAAPRAERVEMSFPFDPRVTSTTVLPATWDADGTLRLPAVLSAPDFGQMLVACAEAPHLQGRLEGSRERKIVDFTLDVPRPTSGDTVTLDLSPVRLPPPKGLSDTALWRGVRRGWFGAFQPCARWGEQDRPFSAPPGILGNNVVSDPASCSLWFYADQALWTPEVAPGISVMALVRRTVDWWLDQRTRPDGEVVCYWDYGNFLDANAGPLIAAWDYVEATGDLAWLARRVAQLERIADFLARRDVDGDGLVEATQSGNRGTLRQPARSCAWWDALNCGHKDAYTNALVYRAWRCLADLEARLGRPDAQARYGRLADRLRSAYAATLLHPKTGWLAWWKSADGEMHDYAAPTVNGLAIEYGLVDPARGREILEKLSAKMREAGFTRFDLGVPPMLVPVLRADYLLPDAIGCPKKADGTDTFGQYMNGGITAGHVLHYLAAHYVVGAGEKADAILRAMLERQARGGFQNGVRDEGMKGIDWTTWDGKPCGYEGYLADSFRFLQAALLREPSFRARLYRPLAGAARPPGSPTETKDEK